ncbi:SNARE domain protein [Sphaerosporella brunnea]|uniref:SNARE domain protein n=1 Tax=Sphaerosporella brunnea TaxID=1250544 RepID=A0A5J5EQJ8_9PEZI|nr:SNARE domain protein [Sphaerosporella brunnea]
MSFDRLPSLEAQPTTTRGTGYNDDPAFSSLTTSLSARLFTLTSNITQLNRQLALVGSNKDSETVRERVNKLLEETRQGFRDISDGVKRVKAWEDPSPAMKYSQDKLQSQLTSTMADFQAVQRLSAEKARQYVAAVKRNVHEEDPERYTDEPSGPEVPLVQAQQAQAAALADQNEIEFHESLIIQREEEIRNIERGITEVADIFRDLGTMVNAQGGQMDMIDANIENVTQNHRAADLELWRASRYQRSSRNKACCLLLILSVVLTVVLLAARMLPYFNLR